MYTYKFIHAYRFIHVFVYSHMFLYVYMFRTVSHCCSPSRTRTHTLSSPVSSAPSLSGTRAIGAEGRSLQQVLQDACVSIREIKHTHPSTRSLSHTRTHAFAASRSLAPFTPTQYFPAPPPLPIFPENLVGLDADISEWGAACPPPPPPFCVVPLGLDDETVRQGMLASHSLAVFEVEIPGENLCVCIGACVCVWLSVFLSVCLSDCLTV